MVNQPKQRRPWWRLSVIEVLVCITVCGLLMSIFSKPICECYPHGRYARFLEASRKANGVKLQYTIDPESKKPVDPSTEYDMAANDSIVENAFLPTGDHPVSTFPIDVDTGMYPIMESFFKFGDLPPKGAIRLEELINYFDYQYEPPGGDQPFGVGLDAAECPWDPKHALVRISLKGCMLEPTERPPMNLVFLLDASGSMQVSNKLPLFKEAMGKLVRQLSSADRVVIVVYGGPAGVILPSTSGDQEEKILGALDWLGAVKSNYGGEGIRLAYAMAAKNHLADGVNRVILCTDGDFNVGVTNQSDLIDLIERKAREGVFLSVLGFGMGNYKDSTLEKLADRGNGNYGYIDTAQEAEKMLVRRLAGTLVTIAKDVKIQVEFNPSQVKAYRLLGYENRLLRQEDFNDDTKDAGEIGAGHTVTAFYEIIPTDSDETIETPPVDPLRYQGPVHVSTEKSLGAKDGALPKETSDELLTVKLRYKRPDSETSERMTFSLENRVRPFSEAGTDFRFASAVAAFGMVLRDSAYRGDADFTKVFDWAESSLGEDSHGERKAFLGLVRQAASLQDEPIADTDSNAEK